MAATAYHATAGATQTVASTAYHATADAAQLPARAAELAKAEARREFLTIAEAQIDAAIARQRFQIGADPSMPRPVARMLRAGVDTFAPDVKYEAMRAIEGAVHANKKTDRCSDAGRSPAASRWPCACLRARYLYALYAYDRTIWRKLRDPTFLLINAFKAVPFAGIQSFMFLLNLLLIDRTDEYQLVSYVQAFKSFQFYTTGIVSSFVGNVMYLSCAGLRAQTHRCEAVGPGSDPDVFTFVLSICGFVLQVVLAWVALRLMRSAIPKGGKPQRQYQLVGKVVSVATPGATKRRSADVVRYHRWSAKHTIRWRDGDGAAADEVLELDSPDVDHIVHQERNHLERLCAYDIVSFFLVVGVVVLLMFATNSTRTWQVQQLLFWAKTWYALLAFPYQAFSLPGIAKVLTHARPTGYDKQGNCVPLAIPDFGEDDDDGATKEVPGPSTPV